jgi:ribosome-binding protein aMBF1 (putative translation factor)
MRTALRPAELLSAQLVNTSHEIPETDLQPVSEFEQVHVRRVRLAPDHRVDLIEAQAAVVGDCRGRHLRLFGDEDLDGLGKRRVIAAEWFGLPRRGHDRQPYRSGQGSVSQSISYDRCRQSSTAHFAMTSLPRPSQLLSLGRAIRELREEQGLNDKQLAERAGMPHERVTAIEEGASSSDYASLVKLADALDISISALVECAKAIDEEAAND